MTDVAKNFKGHRYQTGATARRQQLVIRVHELDDTTKSTAWGRNDYREASQAFSPFELEVQGVPGSQLAVVVGEMVFIPKASSRVSRTRAQDPLPKRDRTRLVVRRLTNDPAPDEGSSFDILVGFEKGLWRAVSIFPDLEQYIFYYVEWATKSMIENPAANNSRRKTSIPEEAKVSRFCARYLLERECGPSGISAQSDQGQLPPDTSEMTEQRQRKRRRISPIQTTHSTEEPATQAVEHQLTQTVTTTVAGITPQQGQGYAPAGSTDKKDDQEQQKLMKVLDKCLDRTSASYTPWDSQAAVEAFKHLFGHTIEASDYQKVTCDALFHLNGILRAGGNSVPRVVERPRYRPFINLFCKQYSLIRAVGQVTPAELVKIVSKSYEIARLAVPDPS